MCEHEKALAASNKLNQLSVTQAYPVPLVQMPPTRECQRPFKCGWEGPGLKQSVANGCRSTKRGSHLSSDHLHAFRYRHVPQHRFPQVVEQLPLPGQRLQPQQSFRQWVQPCESQAPGNPWGLSLGLERWSPLLSRCAALEELRHQWRSYREVNSQCNVKED